MEKPNQDIRKMAKEKGVPLWRLADKVGLNDGNLSRKLRHELSEPNKQKYLAAIEEVAREMEEDGRKTET